MKRMKMIRLYSIITLLASMFVISACQNDQEVIKDFDSESQELSAKDNLYAEAQFDDIFNTDYEAMEENSEEIDNKISNDQSQKKALYKGCATITITIQGDKKKMVIDFGDEGCKGPDGKIRRGKIISVFNKRMIQHGSIVTTTLENFSINNVKIEGTKTVSNISTEIAVLKHRVKVEGAKITFPDESSISWNCDRFRSWVAGLNTPLN